MNKLRYLIIILSLALGGCGASMEDLTTPDQFTSGVSSGPLGLFIKVINPLAITSSETGKKYLPYLSSTEIKIQCQTTFTGDVDTAVWLIKEMNEWSKGEFTTSPYGARVYFKAKEASFTSYSNYSADKKPLHFQIWVHATNDRRRQINDPLREDDNLIEIMQDNIDDLRQEYRDVFLNRGVIDGEIPSRDKFDNVSPTLSPLHSDSLCPRHTWWILATLDSKVLEIYQGLFFDKGISLMINSGYRCPVGNNIIGGAPQSEHIYGIAFDWDFGSENNKTNSQVLYSIYKYIRDNYNQPRAQNILYDESGTLYFDPPKSGFNSIPTDYNAQSSTILFTHGHTDWRNGW